MNIDTLLTELNSATTKAIETVSTVDTFYQLGLVISIFSISYGVAYRVRRDSHDLSSPPSSPKNAPLKALIYRTGKLFFPTIAIVLLWITIELSQLFIDNCWLIHVALVIAILLFFHSFINLLITNPVVAKVFRWIGMPIIFLHFIGALDSIVYVLDATAIEVGDFKLSVYGVSRTVIIGTLLFWLGRISNTTGQTIIRKQESLDFKTREVFAKIFEIVLFFTVMLFMLQLLGINLTALAVFGGAVGVGLGFGLQAIASNFISGVIIIMDRSVSVEDYIELEDGRTGFVTALNMRSTTLETYDGKDIVVPNEKFITGTFTNWTHKNKKQRYRVDFSVGYKTDVRKLVDLIKAAVANHPQVMSGDDLPIEERPDCEIASFGDSGVNMFVEFWMEGIDDGKNRVGGDLLLIILETLQENGIEIPFPKRDIQITNTEEIAKLSLNLQGNSTNAG